MDIAARGRHLNVVLFGAQQFRSKVDDEILGNCGTSFYGRVGDEELTNAAYRTAGVARAPVVVWINLDTKAAVDELHRAWSKSGARIVAAPESKPWNLHEFIAADLDGNLFRVFYDFAWELSDRGGRVDDTEKQEAARART